MHHCNPIVQVTVDGHLTFVAVGWISVSCCIGSCITSWNLCAICVVCGAQVFPHPALVANLHGTVDVTVIIGHSVCTGTGLGINQNAVIDRVSGGEDPLFPVGRARAVGGVGPDVVSGAGNQACNAACKATCAITVKGVAVVHGGVRRSAPADTARSHGSATASRDKTTGPG